MADLTQLKCVACRGGEPTLTDAEIAEYHPQVPEWQIVERNAERQLERTFKFKNFAQALAFTNQVGDIAEAEDHHPQIITAWSGVTVQWWTHKIHGLHRNDFVMAAKTNLLYSNQTVAGIKQ